MSLPWRFSSADRYAQGTVMKLEAASPTYKHLNVGRYYLSSTRPSFRSTPNDQRGDNLSSPSDDLTDQHLDRILAAASTNPHLNELTFCGIEVTGVALERLRQLLLARQEDANRTWKRLNLHGTTLVSSIIVDVPVPTLRAIRLKHCRLDVKQSVALQKSLVLNPVLETLELVEEDMTDPSVVLPLALGLACTKSLKTLELSYCPFTIESMQCLAQEGLARNETLESLLLPGCGLEDDVASELVRSLRHHPRLKHLKLFRNHCGSQAAVALADLLRGGNTEDNEAMSHPPSPTKTTTIIATTGLESLDLSYQQFERPKKLDVQVIAGSLARNKSLLRLTMSFNKLSDADASCLAVGLKGNSTLLELDLRANNIRDEGVAAISEHVVGSSVCVRLKKLLLFGNPFGEPGGQSLLKAMRKNTLIEALSMECNLSTYDTIQLCTFLNKMGRRLMKHGHEVNPGVWPLILERANGRLANQTRGACTSNDLLHSFLRDPAVFNCLR